VLNCRSIPNATWEQAREALVFYFRHRMGDSQAEDLAQETLAALLRRDDFEFQKSEDFLRVCYGFARRILQSGARNERKHAGVALTDEIPASSRPPTGLNSLEMRVYLDEVIAVGQSALLEQDWRNIRIGSGLEEPSGSEPDHATSNAARVRLFRARRKLAALTGWTRKK
jgi:DNA-directed RNA polymerase specialized sigma24 family protein